MDKSRVNGEGFVNQNRTSVEKGIHKSLLCSYYESGKTGHERGLSDGTGLVVSGGQMTLDQIIEGVEYGLLIGRFSGGIPGASGDLSGLAKNSYLIESGKIVCAVKECMINGNLADMLHSIRALSSEIVCNGSSCLPYIAVDGVTMQ